MDFLGPLIDLARPNIDSFYEGVQPPSVKELELMLNEYVQQGIMTPEDAQYYAANPSAFEAIASDPALQDAQMNALMGLQDISAQGGLNAQAKARLHDIAKEENVRERGGREAIMQQAQAKGQSGSGMELLNLLKNQQESAGRAADRGTQVSADAEQRALEALMQSGNMAGNIRSQDFDEKSKKASAIDALNRFNTANKSQVNQFNVGNRNKAQQYNLDTRQNIANQNTNLKNKQQGYNKELLVNDYNRRMGRADIAANSSNEEFDRIRNAGVAAGKGASAILGGGMDAYGANQMQKKRQKNLYNQIPVDDGWEY